MKNMNIVADNHNNNLLETMQDLKLLEIVCNHNHNNYLNNKSSHPMKGKSCKTVNRQQLLELRMLLHCHKSNCNNKNNSNLGKIKEEMVLHLK